MKIFFKALSIHLILVSIIYLYYMYDNNQIIDNCDSGYIASCSEAINILRYGDNITDVNINKAYMLAQKGCNLDHSESCFEAGILSSPYIYFPKTISNDQGIKEDLSLREINEFGVKIDKEKSIYYKTKACDLGNNYGCLAMTSYFKDKSNYEYPDYNENIHKKEYSKDEINDFNILQEGKRYSFIKDYFYPYYEKTKNSSINQLNVAYSEYNGYECRKHGMILTELIKIIGDLDNVTGVKEVEILLKANDQVSKCLNPE